MSTLFAKTGHAEYTVLEAGLYYVGDPCYCFSHSTTTWSEFCNSVDKTCQGIFVNADNTKSILALSTAYGDGCYTGFVNNTMHDFPVDAGILGLVKVKDIELGCSYLKSDRLGRVIELSEGSVVTRSSDGTFRIADANNNEIVCIHTSEDPIAEDDDYYGYNEEDE